MAGATPAARPLAANDVGMRWLYIIFGVLIIVWIVRQGPVRATLAWLWDTFADNLWTKRSNLERSILIFAVVIVLVKYSDPISAFLESIADAITSDRIKLQEYNARRRGREV